MEMKIRPSAMVLNWKRLYGVSRDPYRIDPYISIVGILQSQMETMSRLPRLVKKSRKENGEADA